MNKISATFTPPSIPIHLQIGTVSSFQIEVDLEVLVDTGDETEILARVSGYVTIGEFEPIKTNVITLGDEPLIGREVIDQFKLTIDHGKKLTLES